MKSLTQIIIENGIENIYFLINVQTPRSLNCGNLVGMLYIIDETRYKVSENYKLGLKPIYDRFNHEYHYIGDLEKMINRGDVKLLVQTELN